VRPRAGRSHSGRARRRTHASASASALDVAVLLPVRISAATSRNPDVVGQLRDDLVVPVAGDGSGDRCRHSAPPVAERTCVAETEEFTLPRAVERTCVHRRHCHRGRSVLHSGLQCAGARRTARRQHDRRAAPNPRTRRHPRSLMHSIFGRAAICSPPTQAERRRGFAVASGIALALTVGVAGPPARGRRREFGRRAEGRPGEFTGDLGTPGSSDRPVGQKFYQPRLKGPPVARRERAQGGRLRRHLVRARRCRAIRISPA
jgi:hypothetical protein